MKRMTMAVHGGIAGLSMALSAGTAAAAVSAEYVYRPTPSSAAKAREFVENQKSFRLGFLPTEQANPITASLERDFKRSFVDGVECLQRADRQVPIAMRHVIVTSFRRAGMDRCAGLDRQGASLRRAARARSLAAIALAAG